MSSKVGVRMHLSAKGMLGKVREIFQSIENKREGISLADCLMSGLAIFKLKYPSLLQFDDDRDDAVIQQNLKSLFRLKHIPSDTYMRERLDKADPQSLRPAFTSIFAMLQRGKALEKYCFLEGKYLLLSDGTGYFSSPKIHCKNCCAKHHRGGEVTYYHQFLGVVIAHPDHQEVIPLCPEPIMKEDGAEKNDCERNATERMLRDFRREHPHLPVVLAEDGLASNGPHIKLLKELGISFITVVSPSGNKSLFDWIKAFKWDGQSRDESHGEFSFVKDGITHKFRYVNDVPLNDSYQDIKINFLEYWATDSRGKTYHNSWITDIFITISNVYDIARGGRARWHIENETFNTLKTQDYHFDHNFGHGNENLSTVFAMLMMLAFLIDQCEQSCCRLFQGALGKMKYKKIRLWYRVRGFFIFHKIASWESLYNAIIGGAERYAAILDSS